MFCYLARQLEHIMCSNWDRPQHSWKSYPAQSQVQYDNPFIYKLKIKFAKTELSVWQEYLSYPWVQKAMNSWCLVVFANSVALLLPLTTDWLGCALTSPLSCIQWTSDCLSVLVKCIQLIKVYSFAVLVQHVHPGKDAPHQQCCVKEEYTDGWKIFKSLWLQMKIKYENLNFSWVRHALC